jgi:hypothetical protein
MKRLLILASFLALVLPSYGEKKKQPKSPPQPTQADITHGCVVLSGITYIHRGGPFSSKDTGVSGAIKSGCARETEVSITIKFYDSYNNEIDIQFVTKLVMPASTVAFWGGPDWRSHASVYAPTGRVTSVSVRAIP